MEYNASEVLPKQAYTLHEVSNFLNGKSTVWSWDFMRKRNINMIL